MALTMCPGCNRAVSKYNETCPYCGVLVNENLLCPKCNSKKLKKRYKQKFGFGLFGKKTDCVGVCVDCGKRFKIC